MERTSGTTFGLLAGIDVHRHLTIILNPLNNIVQKSTFAGKSHRYGTVHYPTK